MALFFRVGIVWKRCDWHEIHTIIALYCNFMAIFFKKDLRLTVGLRMFRCIIPNIPAFNTHLPYCAKSLL